VCEEIRLTVGEDACRLDKYIADHTDISRSQAKALLENGAVLADGRPAKAKDVPRPGTVICFTPPAPQPIEAQPEEMDLSIVYEDGDIAVIDKPKGMVVHPAPGNPTGTLVNGLLAQLESLSGINGQLRPGIVHRIDKDTTGLLVVAKNDAAHRSLAEQIQAKTARREYLALVNGHMREPKGTIDAPIGRSPKDRKKMAIAADGRPAVTHYEVVAEYPKYSLLRLKLETGRTHQIRVHLAHLGHSVAGDEVYGHIPCPYRTQGQALHACQLTLTHPRTGEEMVFTSPLPEYFQEILEKLEKMK